MWNFFIENRRFTLVVLISFVVMGFVSILQIPKESNPEVDIPVGVVTTVFPGASATDVEELITSVIEDKILSLDKVKEITSTSRENISVIAVEFDAKADSERQVDLLKDKVDEAKPELPDEANEPRVEKVRFSDEPIYTLALSGPYTAPELKEFAERLKDDVERVAGVSKVNIAGGQEREVQVLVDRAKLDTYGVSVSEVTVAIAQANADVPTGSIETGGYRYTLRLSGSLRSAEDVRRVPVHATNGAVVFVGDVADVVDGYAEQATIARLSVEGSAPLPAVSLGILKSPGGNILSVIDTAEERVEQARQSYFPGDITIEVIDDQAEYIREDLTNLSTSGAQSVLMVALLLFLFLGWREALLASLAIPTSFLVTFIFLLGIGSSINFLSLFSLILALGILIDSAIVIVESMHQRIASGIAPIEAARGTVHDFQAPLIAGTLTTVFAFVPMLLASGILGQFIKHIPITVTAVLLSSLVIALGMVTTIGSMWLKRGYNGKNGNNRNGKTDRAERIFAYLVQPYRETLRRFLERRSRQRIVIAGITILFFAAFALPAMGVLPINMFPPDDFGFFFIDVTKPSGTPLEVTNDAIRIIESALTNDERVQSFLTNVGVGSITGGGSGSNVAHFIVNLVDTEKREETSFAIVEQYQRAFTNTVNADVSITQVNSGPPTGAPVEITINGPNLVELDRLANEFEDIVKEVPGTQNTQTTVEEPSGEFLIRIDRAKAQIYGVTALGLAQILRNTVNGISATELRVGGEEVDVVVKSVVSPELRTPERTNIISITDLESLAVPTRSGSVPLTAMASVELGGNRPIIHHVNGDRIARITSYTQSGVQPTDVFGVVSEKMKDMNIPADYGVKLGGEAEDVEQSYNDMFRAMILAVFLIAATLVFEFDSFLQSIIVLATIPLALIGVFPGLVIMGQPLSFPGIIGVVALAGIVVNNAIILIDRMNALRKKGEDLFDAVIHAAESRLQPIILTTVTTVIGIIPITLSSSLWGPLGYAIIFGLSASAAFTLFIIPMLYARAMRPRGKNIAIRTLADDVSSGGDRS